MKKVREKGLAFERSIANKLKTIYSDAKRGFQFRTGEEAPDVDVPDWWIECKAVERLDLRKAWEQAKNNSEKNKSKKIPIAICKKNHKEILVVMEFNVWVQLIKLFAKRIIKREYWWCK